MPELCCGTRARGFAGVPSRMPIRCHGGDRNYDRSRRVRGKFRRFLGKYIKYERIRSYRNCLIEFLGGYKPYLNEQDSIDKSKDKCSLKRIWQFLTDKDNQERCWKFCEFISNVIEFFLQVFGEHKFAAATSTAVVCAVYYLRSTQVAEEYLEYIPQAPSEAPIPELLQ